MSRDMFKALDKICPKFHTGSDSHDLESAPLLVGDGAMQLLSKSNSFSCIHCYPTTKCGLKNRLLVSLFARPDRSLFLFDEPIVRIVVKKICGERRVPVRDHIWVQVSNVCNVYPDLDPQLLCLTLFRTVRLLIADYFICEQDLVRIDASGHLELHVLLLLSLSMFNNWKLHLLFVNHLIDYDASMPTNARRYPANTEEALAFYAPPFLLDVMYDYGTFADTMRERHASEYMPKGHNHICRDVFCSCPVYCSNHMSLSNMRRRRVRNEAQYRQLLRERLKDMSDHMKVTLAHVPPHPPPPPPVPCARQPTECCVCLDSEISVVFRPCGHTVCCEVCSSELSVCVLCRAPIQSKTATTEEEDLTPLVPVVVVVADRKEPWCITEYMLEFGRKRNPTDADPHTNCFQVQGSKKSVS